MKKITALLLALLMALSLALVSCGDTDDDGDETKKAKSTATATETSDDVTKDNAPAPSVSDNDSLVGEWVWNIDLAESMATMFNMDKDSMGKLELPLVLELKSNGNYELSVDEKKFEDNWDTFVVTFKDAMIELMYATMEETMGKESPSRDELAEAFKEETGGQSIEEYVDEVIAESMTFDSIIESMDMSASSGKYTVDGNVIDLDGDECTFEIKGDELILDTEHADDLPEFITFPATLVRK